MATRAEVAIPCNFNGAPAVTGPVNKGFQGVDGRTQKLALTAVTIYIGKATTQETVLLTDQENCCA